jgi:hypothetical protein
MENILIPVPPFIAQAYEKADWTVKRKAEIYINAWLYDFFSSRPANEQLFEVMQKGSAEARANGFTSEKLEELLKDENLDVGFHNQGS